MIMELWIDQKAEPETTKKTQMRKGDRDIYVSILCPLTPQTDMNKSREPLSVLEGA